MGGETEDETGQHLPVARALAWRPVGAAEADGGPRRLRLATPKVDSDGSVRLALPGSGLDALLASSAAITAAELGLGDPLIGFDGENREYARRLGAYADGAWAAELGLATESPILERLLDDGAPLIPPAGPEATLGVAMARALEEGISRGCVDVALLRDAAGPLEELLALLPGWGDGLLPRLTLDPDVLQLARTSWRLLHVTHQAWFAARNRSLDGDPRRVFHHPVDAWARQLTAAAPGVVARTHVLRTLEETDDDIRELVKQHFTWAAEADRDGFAHWLEGRITTPVSAVLEVTDSTASALARKLEPHLPELGDEDDVVRAIADVTDYLEAWLQTDAGLLARLHRELHLASDAWSWRRVGLTGDDGDWAVADVAGAAHAAAAALDAEDLIIPQFESV